MKTSTMTTSAMPRAPVGKAWEEVSASFDRFCLAAGIETLGAMMEADAEVACGPRHSRSEDRRGDRAGGRTQGKIGFHAGKVVIERPRVRGLNGKELPLESWGAGCRRGLARRVGDEPDADQRVDAQVQACSTIAGGRRSGAGGKRGVEVGGLAPLRRALGRTPAGVDDPLDLSKLDLLVIQIDSIHMDEDSILVAAIGVDAKGDKHPLGLIEGATENAATVQALIDNLVERGLDPAVPRLFIIDGAKALSKAIRRTFGRTAAIQRCQIPRPATL